MNNRRLGKVPSPFPISRVSSGDDVGSAIAIEVADGDRNRATEKTVAASEVIECRLKCPVPVAEQDRRVTGTVHHGEIENAVGVQVAGGDGSWIGPYGGVVDGRLKSPVWVAEKDAHQAARRNAVVEVGRGDVEPAVPVEISQRHCPGARAIGVGHGVLEGEVAIAQQNAQTSPRDEEIVVRHSATQRCPACHRR